MRFVTLVLLFVVASSLSARAQSDFVLSPRVGHEISAEKQAYFGLFPRLNDF
jgi:hypothetical protein